MSSKLTTREVEFSQCAVLFHAARQDLQSVVVDHVVREIQRRQTRTVRQHGGDIDTVTGAHQSIEAEIQIGDVAQTGAQQLRQYRHIFQTNPRRNPFKKKN